jgi:paraquat-inducible protein A
VLTVSFREPFSRAFSFASASLIMLAIALAFPFLSISASGVTNSMTLIQTVSYLAEYGLFVILVPLVMLTLIGTLAVSLGANRFPEMLLPAARWLFHLNAWSMVEVFAIGVIVSLVKLAAMAKVSLGVSFWAYLAFTVLFLLAFSSMDRLTVWTAIDRIRTRRRAQA